MYILKERNRRFINNLFSVSVERCLKTAFFVVETGKEKELMKNKYHCLKRIPVSIYLLKMVQT